MAHSPHFSHSPPSQAADGGRLSIHNLVNLTSGRLSPATLTLQRVFEQSLRGIPKGGDDSKPADGPLVGPPGKGKPRLLLMGQRR
jgi:Ras-related GTP-binding protein C/D